MSELLKLTGIYDLKTIQLGIEKQVFHFGFDFRPRSPNFLQEYVFKEILETGFDPRANYYLHYQDEKDFMIMKMIDEVKDSLLKIGRDLSNLEKFKLYFSDVKNTDFYKILPLNFIWEYHPLGRIEEISGCKNNLGVTIPWNTLQEIISSNGTHEFVMKILKAKQNRKKLYPELPEYTVSMQIDWGSDVIPSLGEFLTIDMVELPINCTVENSYRNVNLQKVSQCLQDIKNITIQNL